jgi:regulatory protein
MVLSAAFHRTLDFFHIFFAFFKNIPSCHSSCFSLRTSNILKNALKPKQQKRTVMGDGSDTPHRKALNSALRILARRDHSVAELSQKLTCRGYGEDIVQGVVAECQRLNYLDDERAARQIIDWMKRKGMGVRRIRSELLRRGLEGDSAEALLRECVPAAEEQAMARRLSLKKWKTFAAEPDSQKKKLRLQRFLHYRGFSDSVILEMLKELRS